MRAITTSSGDCQNTYIAPSTFASARQSPSANVHLSSPPCETLCFAIQCQINITAAVLSLFLFSGPFHVARLIMSIIVDSIQRMKSRGASPYSCQKLFERIESKFNSATTVIKKVCYVHIRASISRTSITYIFRARNVFRCFAVGTLICREQLSSQTPTRLGITSNQITSNKDANCSARTLTPPLSQTGRICTRITQYGQASKLQIGQISKIINRWMRDKFNGNIVFRHLFKTSFLNNLASRVEVSFRFLQPAFIITDFAII